MAQTARHNPAEMKAVWCAMFSLQGDVPQIFTLVLHTVCTARRTLLQGDLLLEEELAWLLLPSLPWSANGVWPPGTAALPIVFDTEGSVWSACKCTETRGLQPAFIALDQDQQSILAHMDATDTKNHCCTLLQE